MKPSKLLTDLKKHYEHSQIRKTRAELKEKATADATATPDDSKIYKEWIAKYHKEQSNGFAIPQCINALQTLNANQTSRPDSKGKSESVDPPPYSSTTLDEMISALKHLYREHLETLQNTLALPPTGGRAGDYHEFEFLRVRRWRGRSISIPVRWVGGAVGGGVDVAVNLCGNCLFRWLTGRGNREVCMGIARRSVSAVICFMDAISLITGCRRLILICLRLLDDSCTQQ